MKLLVWIPVQIRRGGDVLVRSRVLVWRKSLKPLTRKRMTYRHAGPPAAISAGVPIPDFFGGDEEIFFAVFSGGVCIMRDGQTLDVDIPRGQPLLSIA